MSEIHRPLEGLRVVESATTLSARLCAMLLADLGAEVIRIGEASDNPLDRNKRATPLDPAVAADRQALLGLIGAADVLVEDSPTRALAWETLCRDHPRLIHCSLSPFGRTGPWHDKPACDLIVQAATGAMGVTGEPGRPPTKMGLPLGDEIAGVLGAVAILAAERRRETTGRGGFIDIAAADAGLAMLSYMTNIFFATGESPRKLGSSHPTIFPYNAFRTRDGHIVAAPFTQTFWRKFCAAIGRDDLPANPAYRSFAERLQNRPQLSAIIDAIFLERSTAEWEALLEAGDVPNGPVNSIAAALEMEQTRHRGMVVAIEGTGQRSFGSPFRFAFEDKARFVPRYRPPETLSRDAIRFATPAAAKEATGGGGAAGAPLAGIRVLDLTRMFAGPYCGQLLADLGADVIKIEEPRIGDPTRRNIPMIDGHSTYFMAVNRGKRSIALDAKQPGGRAVMLRLAAKADVLIENFRPGVMARLGLSYDDLRRVNPDIVLLSLSGFGQSGPLRDKTSFDLVNQAMSGTMAITGEPGRPPVRIGLPVGDLSGGIFGTLAVLAALRTRHRKGWGAAIDLSLHDLMLALIGPVTPGYFAQGESPGAMGSADRAVVPSRAYEAADGWIALAVQTDAQWAQLALLLGRPELARDEAYRTNAARLARRAEVDAILEQALLGATVAEWTARLDAAGVPNAPVLSLGEALQAEQTAARGMVLGFDHQAAGRCQGVGTAMHLDGALAAADRPPPLLGEHTEEVLRGLLGLGDAEMAALRAEGAIP